METQAAVELPSTEGLSVSDEPAPAPAEPEPKCLHQRCEWFEDLRWFYDGDPRCVGAKILRMENHSGALRHCLDCGIYEKAKA